MSDLRVALVAEGPTDTVVIEAALKALLPMPFVLTQLQLEPTRPKLGTGWGGVLRWCLEFAARGHARLEDDPTLSGFGLFILHIDADVAEFRYVDLGNEVDVLARQRDWPTLPCSSPCPPPKTSANAIRDRLCIWAGLAVPGPKTVLCVPSKTSEAWLVAALFDSGHILFNGLECNRNLEARLKALPSAERVRKTKREYLARSAKITAAWDTVRRQCTQAERFSREILRVVPQGH